MAEKLNEIELLKWRLAMSEWNLAKEKLSNRELMLKMMDKDIENAKLRANIYNYTTIPGFKANVDAARKEYDEVVASLSVNVKGKTVNELTGEVLTDEELD